MKMVTHIFNVFVAVSLLACIGLQMNPVHAQQSWTISGSTGVPGATISYFDGTAQTATADGNGNYSFAVSDGFAGTVTPSKTGYTVVFTPTSIDYASTPVTSDQNNQNYVPDTSWWTVSGNVGVAGAVLDYSDGSPETVTADGNGDYSLLVPDNFAGTITPSLTGYSFTPASIDYASTPITANLTDQDYTATPITYTISGNAGAAGVTLSYIDGTPKTAIADINGDYSFTVSYNWPGTVTPSLAGYTFTPASIDYSSTPVSANLTGQDYAPTAITYTISGNVGIADATLSYTDGIPKTVVSDNAGNYSLPVSYNWSGSVTPSKISTQLLYTFTPANKAYSNVTADVPGQNYTYTSKSASSHPQSPQGNIRDTTPTFVWKNLVQATQYEYRLFRSGTLVYGKIVSSAVCAGSLCSSTPATVLQEGKYSWMIRAQVGGLWKEFSTMNFVLSMWPIPQSPKGYILDTTPTYVWSRVTEATKYEYTLYKNGTVIYTKVVSSAVCVNATCSNTPSTVLGYISYRWRVRAMIGGVWKEYGDFTEFTVDHPMANGNFELGIGGWVQFSTHHWQLIVTSFPGTVRPHSGKYAVWLGGDYNDTSYIQQKVVVPSNAPYLTYWYWIASASANCFRADEARVWINTTKVEDYDLCKRTNTGIWKQRSIDLSAYVGQKVLFKINVSTNGVDNSNLFIDDISFQAKKPTAVSESVVPDFDPLITQDHAGFVRNMMQPN